MKRICKIILTALLLVFLTSALDVPNFGNMAVAQSATLKISNAKLVLVVGKTNTLQVTGTKSKITWSSNNESIATVTSKGKVTAVAVGSAKITAKVGSKKLTCNVTVIYSNPYQAKAPFKAEVTQIDNLNFVIPSGWKVYNQNLAEDYIYTQITPPKSSNLNSIIRINIMKQDCTPNDYEMFKEAFKDDYTIEKLKPEWKELFGNTKYTISDLEQSDFAAPFNKVLKTQYTVNAEGMVITKTIYDFYIGSFIISFMAEDYDEMDLAAMADYLVNSFMIK